MGDTIAQTRFENVSTQSYDPLLARGNTLRSGEDILKLDELMELCTNLQQRTHKLKRLYKVSLSARVESSGDEEDLGKDASKQGRRINAIDADEDITLVNVQNVDEEMFDVDALDGEEVFAAGQNENVVEEVVDVAQVSTAATTVTITTEEITLAQALEALKTSKPKVKGIIFQEPGESTTTKSKPTKSTPTISSQQSKDKGKRIMIEEHVKPMKKKDLIRLDEENGMIFKQRLKADHELAERLQAQEQEELSVEEKAKLFQQLLEQRRKNFAAKRAEEKRNKPPTQAQQRKIMCTYLKNMEGKKLKYLKHKSFDSIQKMFDKALKRVNTFVNFRANLVEGSSKRAGEVLEQKSTKKQKVDEDKDTTELQSLMEVIPDEEEVAIDVVPLATKSPSIVLSQMLKSFTREDLEDLYKLVKAKYGSTRPVEDLDLVLWNDLKTMFEPHVEDEIWKLQQRRNLIILEINIKFRGGLLGLKVFLMLFGVTAALIDVNAAQSNTKLLLLVEVKTAQRLKRKTAK
ncbi:hypothetical protein Tco_0039873 [Tanacetum coccineum]